MTAQHLRIARPTNRLESVSKFYQDVLGFTILATFQDHEGFDGAMLGDRGQSVHFEFTHEHGAPATPPPSSEHLVVFYLEEEAWRQIQERIHLHDARIVRSHNPYWDRHGVTIEDPDGYRIVLHRGPWIP